MSSRHCFVIVLACVLHLAPRSTAAQDGGALIDVLVRKGILTHEEAAEVRAELIRENAAPPPEVVAGGGSTGRISLGGRLQVQFAGLGTEVARAADPAATHHAFIRRAYVTIRANLLGDWSTGITYDFAGGGFDEAVIRWRRANHTIDLGLRKVNNAFEERSSSGAIKALERSSVTRYFVEDNNGRRLGAGSYRVGAFYEGRTGAFFYGAAITNPELTDDFTIAASAGDASNNSPAYWVNAGFAGALEGGAYRFGVSASLQPDQGGPGSTNRGLGFDLALYGAYADVRLGRFHLFSEFLLADVERGASFTRDARPWGWFIQPACLLTEKLELVARYARIDSDGRGITLADGIRSAPSGGTMNTLDEFYLGGTYSFHGDDLKLQLGYVAGQTRTALSGAAARATTQGVRSQLQLQF